MSTAPDALRGVPGEAQRFLGRAGKWLAILILAVLIAVGVVAFSYRVPAGIVAAAVFLVILYRPFWGLLAIVASLPFETAGMLGDVDAPGAISITKLAGLSTMAAVLLNLLLRRAAISMGRVFSFPTVMILCLVGAALIAAIVHPTSESLREALRFVTLGLFFLVTAHLLDRPERLVRLVGVWASVATIVSVYSLFQRAFGTTVGSEEWEPLAATIVDVSEQGVGVMVRAAGSFTHPVWLALYLSIALPLTLFFAWTSNRTAARAGAWCAALLQAAAIVTTYSRMGYLALALGAVLFILRRRGGALLILWSALLLLATAPLWPPTVRARIVSILDYTSSSSSVTRVGQQLVGLWMFRENPFTGVGPGNFEANVERYADRVPDKYPVEKIAAHNMYIAVMAELGILGLVPLVLALSSLWRRTRRAQRTAVFERGRALCEALETSLLVFVFCAVLVHAQYQKECWLLLAVIVAADWVARNHALQALPSTAAGTGADGFAATRRATVSARRKNPRAPGS